MIKLKYPDTTKSLTELFLLSQKEGGNLYEYLFLKFSKSEIEELTKLFQKHQEEVVERVLNINNAVKKIVENTIENDSVLSTDFAKLYSSDKEEQQEVILHLESNLENNKQYFVLCEYINQKEKLLEIGNNYAKHFREDAKEYVDLFAEYVKAREKNDTGKMNSLLLEIGTKKGEVMYSLSHGSKQKREEGLNNIEKAISQVSKVVNKPDETVKQTNSKRRKRKL